MRLKSQIVPRLGANTRGRSLHRAHLRRFWAPLPIPNPHPGGCRPPPARRPQHPRSAAAKGPQLSSGPRGRGRLKITPGDRSSLRALGSAPPRLAPTWLRTAPLRTRVLSAGLRAPPPPSPASSRRGLMLWRSAKRFSPRRRPAAAGPEPAEQGEAAAVRVTGSAPPLLPAPGVPPARGSAHLGRRAGRRAPGRAGRRRPAWRRSSPPGVAGCRACTGPGGDRGGWRGGNRGCRAPPRRAPGGGKGREGKAARLLPAARSAEGSAGKWRRCGGEREGGGGSTPAAPGPGEAPLRDRGAAGAPRPFLTSSLEHTFPA